MYKSILKSLFLSSYRFMNFPLISKSSNLIELNAYRRSFPVRSVCFNQNEGLRCWNCNVVRQSVSDLLCSNCNVLQHPNNKSNYFKVLQISENYDVNTEKLKGRYKQFQRILHPDKFGNKSEKERTISAEYSFLVNEAYKTLLQPLNRAIHILHLNGEQIDEKEKATDPELLMEMMELNEEIEEAQTPNQLRELDQKNKRALAKIENEVLLHFNDGNIQKAKTAVIKMKYFNSVRLRIHELMRDRGIID